MKVRGVVTIKGITDDLNDGKTFIVDEIACVVKVLPILHNPVWIKSKLKGRS